MVSTEIEITTFDLNGTQIDTAIAESEEDATFAARTLLEDAVEAGHELRDLTVVFGPAKQPVVFGRDVMTRRAA
jgi:hypothetical protein